MRQTRARNVWIAISVVVFVSFFAAASSARFQQVIWSALGIGAAVVVGYVTLSRRLWARSAWVCLAIAALLLVFANWLRENDIGMRAISEDSAIVETLLYAITFVLLNVAAFLFVNRRRRNAPDASGILDSSIVFVAAAMLAAQFIVYPFWMDPKVGAPELLALIILTALDILLLSLTVRLWFSTDRTVNRAARMSALGLVACSIAGGLGLQTFLPHPPFAANLVTGLVFAATIVYFGVVGSAVLDPTAARPPASDVDAAIVARTRVLLLMVLCVLVPPIILLLSGPEELQFSTSRGFVLLTLALTILLSLRVNLIIQTYREAVRREHMLREINAGLMRVADLPEVNARLSDWAARLVEQDGVTCVLGTNEELASAGLGPFGGRLRLPNGQLRYRTVVTVPGSHPTRRLVVDSPEIVSNPAQASLAVLGQSLGMALERLALSRRVVERATTERLQLLLHNASDVIALVDSNSHIRYVTEAITELTGQTPPDVLGADWPKLFHDPAYATGLLKRARNEGEARGELVINRVRFDDLLTSANEDERDRRVEVDITWVESDDQYVVTHHDVTDRYMLEQQLAYQAYHDELTGLNNRAVFRKELARAAARSRRSGNPFAVMMIDLDDFKNVNDSMGHPAGDDFLRIVAKRLVECMREGDTPVRLGGDEFAAILESARSSEDAQAVAQRILSELAKPIQLRETEIITSASIGIAMSDGTGDPADAERDADIALYDAKFAGKNQVALFRSDMHDTAVQRMSLTNDLRNALDRGEISVNYQPVVDLETRGIAGAEALVRWQHPTLGELPPASFITLAEETGTIADIGRHVMATALRDLQRWSKKNKKHNQSKVSINISGRQLQMDNVANTLSELLIETGADPQRVVIEVTESVLLPSDSDAAAQLKEIADLGVAVFIDDFGTGWASLHYLRSLPVSGLKLAQEFVAGLPADFDYGLAQAIRELSGSTGLSEVIAEGIETGEQRDALVEMGYRLGQGYLFYAPLEYDKLLSVLKASDPAPWHIGERTDRRAEIADNFLAASITVPEQLSLRDRREEPPTN